MYDQNKEATDHCRIGSLEINADKLDGYDADHCRIGSLEIQVHLVFQILIDHCRIGSLETKPAAVSAH